MPTMTIEEMIAALSEYPRSACCVAKGGDDAGLEIRAPEGDEMLGYISTSQTIPRQVDISEIVF